VQSMIRRVPQMVGPLLGGWLLTRFGWTDGVRYALALCIAMSVLTLAFQWFMFEPDGKTAAQNKNSSAATISFLGVVKSFTPALRELLVSDILIRFCERIPYAFVILWAMDSGGVTAQQFGYLVTFEMVTAMFCYIPVAHLADKYGRRPFVLIEPRQATSVVQLESRRSLLLLHEEKDVDPYHQATEQVRNVALSPADSVRLITEHADRWEKAG